MKGLFMKIIKKLSLLFWIILSAFALFMCEPMVEAPKNLETVKEEILNWNIDVMPHLFLPSIGLSDNEKEMVNHLYEGLTRVIDGEVIYGMAKNITVDDSGLVYRIELKTSKWSDGALIRPEDFIYAWERKEHYYNHVNVLYFEAMIKEVTINDDNELVIELFEKNDQLLHELSHVKFMPLREDVIDFNEPLPVHYALISNGPYYLSSYDDIEGVVLKRNNYYYDFFSVKINSIHVTLDNTYERVHNRIKNDTLHFSESLDWSEIETYLIYEPSFKIYEDNNCYGFLFNKEKKVLNLPEMRALLFEGVEKTSMNPFQAFISDSHKETENMYVNGDKIRAMIDKLDTEKVKELDKLEIVTLDNPNDVALANYLAESWKTYIGINCVVIPQSGFEYYESLKHKNYDVILNRNYNLEENKIEVYNFLLKEDHLEENFQNEQEQTSGGYEASKLMLEEAGLKDTFLYLPLFKNYDTVFMSDRIKAWSRSDEGLFYFGGSHIEYINEIPSDTVIEKGE